MPITSITKYVYPENVTVLANFGKIKEYDSDGITDTFKRTVGDLVVKVMPVINDKEQMLYLQVSMVDPEGNYIEIPFDIALSE